MLGFIKGVKNGSPRGRLAQISVCGAEVARRIWDAEAEIAKFSTLTNGV